MQTSCVIIAGASKWQLAVISGDDMRIVDLPIDENANPLDIAPAIETAMANGDAVGAPTMLAIPSAWCLNASITIGDLPRNDRTAMLYRLEEKLPVAAETVAADFVEDDARALGVCIQLDRVRPLLEALESRHIVVQSIAPLALLAGQTLPDRDVIQLIGEPDGDQVNLLKIVNGRVRAWSLLPANAAAIERQLNYIALKDSSISNCAAVGIGHALLQSLQKQLQVEAADAEVIAIGCELARRVLAGEVAPWIELRRGPLAIADRLRLHRRSLNGLLAAVMVLLLASSAALLWRGGRWAKVDADARQQMNDAFRDHFPDWQVPENVRVIVESEHQKATAAAGASPGRSTRSATRTLVDVLNHLPAEGRFTIETMNFADHSFELQGRVRSLDALDPLIAAAKTSGITVSSPEAHKIAGGFWNFTLRGESESNTPLAKGDQ